MKLTEEQERQLKTDIETIVQQVQDDKGYCGCYEGDINDLFPEAKDETARRIIALLKAWSLI